MQMLMQLSYDQGTKFCKSMYQLPLLIATHLLFLEVAVLSDSIPDISVLMFIFKVPTVFCYILTTITDR